MNYLRFRMRVIGNAALFLNVLRKSVNKSDDLKMSRKRLNLSMDTVNGFVIAKKTFEEKFWAMWDPILSLWLWFTIYTTPAIMLYPDLNQSLYNWLFINEVAWLIEILRMLVFN